MKIVILDGYTSNPGDLSFDIFSKYGELDIYDRTDKDNVIERIGNAEIVITNKVVIDKRVMESCPNIKYIGILATGYNVVDIYAARERKIVVTNVPGYSTDAVAQHTFSLILELANHVGEHSRTVMNGDWIRSRDFSYSVYPGIELAGKTIGIIGYGHIGKKVSEIAHAFGMKALVSSRTRRELPEGGWIDWAERDKLFSDADIISLHCPLFPDTENIINKHTISMMKKSALIINTARGGCIEEQDLADALNEGRIAGAAVDVVSAEPMSPGNPLLAAKNMIITPHIAWAPFETRDRLLSMAAGNMGAFLSGEPVNVVN